MAEANLIVKIGGLLDSSLDRATRSALGRVKALGTELSSIGTSFSLGITAPIVAFGASAINAGKEIESLKLALKTLEGSTAGAERRFRDLQEVAKLPGLGVREAVQADLALRAYGLTAERAKEATLAFGNALAAAGRGKADLAETVRQFGQLSAAGKLTAENLKPIIERVPQVAQILRQQFGVATAEALRDLGVTSQQVIDAIIGGLQKLPPVTSGLKNSIENFSDTWEQNLAKAGKALTPFVAKFLTDFAEPLTKKIGEISEAFQKLPESVQSTIVVFTGLAAVTGPLLIALGSVAGAITNIVALAGKLKAAESLFLALNASIRAIPFAGLAASLGYVLDGLLKTKTAQENLTRANREQANGLEVLRTKYREQQEAIGYLVPGTTGLKNAVFEFAANLKSSGQSAEKSTPKVAALATGVGTLARETEKLRAIRFEDRSLLNQIISDSASRALARVRSRLAELYDEIQRLSSITDSPLGFLFNGQGPTLNGGPLAGIVDEAARGFVLVEEQITVAGRATKDLVADIAKIPGETRIVEEAWARVGLEIGRTKVPGDLKDFSGRIFKEANEAAKKGAKDFEKAERDKERAAREATRHLERYFHRTATAITEVIFKAESVGQAFRKLGTEILKSLSTAIIEAQLKRLTKVLIDWGTSISQTGIGKVLGGLFGADLGKVGVIKNAAGSATSAAGAAASTASQAGSAASQAASSTLASVTGIVTGIASAVSGIISNFQLAGVNKTLDLIEKEVRYSQIHLLEILQNSNKYWPWMQYSHDRLRQMLEAGVPVFNAAGDQGLRISGGGSGQTINVDLRGSTFGGATTEESVREMFTAAARQIALAGGV